MSRNVNESCPLGDRGRLDTEIKVEIAWGYGDANVSKRDWFLVRIAKYSTEGFTEDEVLPGELGLVNRGSNFTHKLIMVGNSNAGRRSNSLLLHSIPLQYSLPQLG